MAYDISDSGQRLSVIAMMDYWNTKTCYYGVAILCLSYVTLARYALTDGMKGDILNIHNSLRRHFAQGSEDVVVANMKKLVWSNSLEEEALRKLRLHCTLSFFHFPNSNRYSNIAKNSSGNFTSDILNWYSEIKLNNNKFYPMDGVCHPRNDCWQAVSMLDATHRYIGCSYRTRCQGESGALLCLYENNDPATPEQLTEMADHFYQRGVECSKCSHPTGFCDRGLCTSCDSSLENCDCRKTCHAAGIGMGVLNETTCSCTCQYGMGLNCDEPCTNLADEMFYEYEICLTATEEDCLQPVIQLHCALQCNVCEVMPNF